MTTTRKEIWVKVWCQMPGILATHLVLYGCIVFSLETNKKTQHSMPLKWKRELPNRFRQLLRQFLRYLWICFNHVLFSIQDVWRCWKKLLRHHKDSASIHVSVLQICTVGLNSPTSWCLGFFLPCFVDFLRFFSKACNAAGRLEAVAVGGTRGLTSGLQTWHRAIKHLSNVPNKMGK